MVQRVKCYFQLKPEMNLGLRQNQKRNYYYVGDRRGPWAATVGVIEFSAEEIKFSELLGVCTTYPTSLNFEFISETSGAESKLINIR